MKSSTGFKGVHKRNSGKFQARLQINRYLNLTLGTYATPEAAALARIKYIDSLK